jgi:hypothetical protein
MNDRQEPLTPEEYLRRLNGGTAPAPKTEQQQTAPSPTTDEGPSPMSRMYRAARSVGRGLKRAWNETAQTAVDLSPYPNKDKWGKDFVQDVGFDNLPERDSGVYGFVDVAAQFMGGFIGASKFLKPVKMLDATVKGLGVTRRSMAAGAVADMGVFDPYEERMSNLISQAPVPVASAMAGLLAADEDDPVIIARLKAGLEGAMIGASVDKLIHGIRAMRAVRKAKAGEITPDAAQDIVQREMAAAEARVPVAADGPATVVIENGRPVVKLQEFAEYEDTFKALRKTEVETFTNITDAIGKKMDAGPSISDFDAALPFARVEQAEHVAASINFAAKNGNIPANTLTDEQRTAVQAIKDRIAAGTDPNDVAALMDGIDFNFRVVDGAEPDTRALINAMSEAMGHDIQLYPFRQVDGFGQGHAETMRQAVATISDADPDTMLENMRRLFGDTDELPRQVTAARWYFYKLADQTAALSRIADMDPSNPVATKNLADALDTLFQAHEWVSGTSANIARTLDAHKIDVTKMDAPPIQAFPKPIQNEAASALKDVKAARKAIKENGGKKPAETPAGGKKPAENGGKAAENGGKKAKGAADGDTPPPDTSGSQGTNAVNTMDFMEARAQQRAAALLRKINAAVNADPVSAEVRELGDVERARQILQDAWGNEKLDIPEELYSSIVGAKGRNPIDDISRVLEQQEKFLERLVNPVSKAEPKAKPVSGEISRLGKSVPEKDITGSPVADAIAGHRATGGLSPEAVRALARTMALVGGDVDPKDIITLIKGAKKHQEAPGKQSFVDYMVAFRTQMLLMGPKTHAVNTASNLVTMFQVPTEHWWAGVRSGNKALRQRGADELGGLTDFSNVMDALKAAAKTMKSGEPRLDPSHRTIETPMADAPQWLGWTKYMVPTRWLSTADEFFKTMTYRSAVRGQSLRLSREMGITDPKEVASRLVEDLKMSVNEAGAAINPKALQQSRYTTFTNDLAFPKGYEKGSLGFGNLGENLQDAANKVPMLRFVQPFVRTPVNIFRFAAQRTPILGRWQADMAADLAAGGERAAIARAKQDAGWVLYSAAALMAYNGLITGGGPSSPALRKQWLEAKNEPYSIRLSNGEQISYRRLEPAATPFALVADFATIFGELDEQDAEDMTVALFAAMAKSSTSKTFLQGMTETMDAISSGDGWTVRKFMGNMAGSFMPNALRQMNPDPVYREVGSLLEDMKSRVPGMSTQLEPRRNFFGEQVMKPPGYFNRSLNPFTVMGNPDPLLDELVGLGQAAATAPRRIGNVDLTDRKLFDNGTGQSPRDRALELMEAPKHGPNVRASVTSLMRSPEWKTLSGGNEDYPGGLKLRQVNATWHGHWKAAYAQMLSEYPKLQQALQDDMIAKGAALIGETETMFGTQKKK